ncbi:MAG: hypothetical protein KJ579_08200 [Verrucomicrobia bacterium]|nr:hypothetical protein [Verrucomicrobiota bacterium]
MTAGSTTGGAGTPRAAVEAVLRRERPPRVVYAPNCWQWFAHHRNHGLLPPEIAHCTSQLDLIRHLGLDVFSRNIYCDPTTRWFGGLATEVWEDAEEEVRHFPDGRDTVTERTICLRGGVLTERLRYHFEESTLVQEKFLLDDPDRQLDLFGAYLRARRWQFDARLHGAWQREVGDGGLVVAGELFSPLKMLHFAAGAQNAVFLIEDHPERCAEWVRVHEEAQLDLVRQMLDAGVEAMMSMDNLDSAFHPPDYLDRCSASFYSRASALCHGAGAAFFVHACGGQRANLARVAALGVDGLEGVAYPPLGDVALDEALRLAGERMIVTGGISAIETERFRTRDEVRRYVAGLLERLEPWRHRFMLSASCNTSIRTPWETLVWFRDAWLEFGGGR